MGSGRGYAARLLFHAGARYRHLDADLILARTEEPDVKEQLRLNTEEAVHRGVFGAPTFFVGEEMFWGNDRLMFVEEALTLS